MRTWGKRSRGTCFLEFLPKGGRARTPAPPALYQGIAGRSGDSSPTVASRPRQLRDFSPPDLPPGGSRGLQTHNGAAFGGSRGIQAPECSHAIRKSTLID